MKITLTTFSVTSFLITILNELKDQYKVDLNQDLLLNDRYKIIEKLGFGAQANVYTACNLKDANKM